MYDPIVPSYPRFTPRHPPARELSRRREVRKRTLLNLSDWPSERIAGFKALLKGGTVIPSEKEAISIIRSLPHGHVAAALGTARRIGLDRLIGPDGNRRRDLVLALAVSRILDPSSKLAAARALSPETAASSLGTSSASGSSTKRSSTRRSTGSRSASRRLRPCSPSATSPAGRWRSNRRDLELHGGPLLPARPVRLQPRRQEGQAPDRLRLALRPHGGPVAVEVFEGSTATRRRSAHRSPS